MDKLKLVEQSLVVDNLPEFIAGDTVNIHYRVKEGEKEKNSAISRCGHWNERKWPKPHVLLFVK